MRLPARIQTLSELVSNQIAAGEVIERPASVVKELLENALDANASSIAIDIGFGGLNRIKVSDNGSGIVADDLPLAVLLHATSKISQLSDLYAIRSMGFRGEALASIASVSRLSLYSKPQEQLHGMMLELEGDKAVRYAPCARSQGTTVDVRDLFFNVPVRKTFLKSEQREYQAIETVVKRFALSAPEIVITLHHNAKLVFALPAARCEQTAMLRVRKLLGKSFMDSAIALDVERAGMRLHGFISGVHYQRSQSDKQWIYINQRMVKDNVLTHALKQAYGPVLHPGRYPACVLYLTMQASEIDVNVHPTKHEVRFQQPRLVHDFIASQISAALAESSSGFESTSMTPSLLTPSQAPCDRGLMLREPSPEYHRVTSLGAEKQPFFHGSNRANSTWLIVNRAFAVIQWPSHCYLVHVERLQQHRWSLQLKESSYPLPARPLLLPVRYEMAPSARMLIDRVLPKLLDWGVQADLVSESCVLIRTIPSDYPLLDLNRWMSGICEALPSEPQWLTLFMNAQSFDAHQLTADERDDAFAYLQDNWSFLEEIGTPLDETTCRGLLYG